MAERAERWVSGPNGRSYSVPELYRLEMGQDALERVQRLADPAELLRQRAEGVDQLDLLNEGTFQEKKPSARELYERERRVR
jgi:hypothetical protein